MWIQLSKTYAGPLGVFPAGIPTEVTRQKAASLQAAKARFKAVDPPHDPGRRARQRRQKKAAKAEAKKKK